VAPVTAEAPPAVAAENPLQPLKIPKVLADSEPASGTPETPAAE